MKTEIKNYRIVLKLLGIKRWYSYPVKAMPEDVKKGAELDKEFSYRMKLRIRPGLRWLFTTEWEEDHRTYENNII